MPTILAGTKFRPVRIGFLVREGNVSDIVTAAELNTLLWGGKRNPIIPISAETSRAERVADIFAVDALVCSADVPELTSFRERFWQLRHPNHHDGLFYQDWRTKKRVLAYLDVISIVDRYWHEDLRHTTKEHRSNCVLVRWEASDPLAPYFSVSFGAYPRDLNLIDDFEGAFSRGLKAHECAIEPDGHVDASISGRITPIDLAGRDLDRYGGGLHESGIYIGDAASAADLITFWNIRAAGPHVRFVPRHQLDRCEPLIRAHLEALDERPPHHARLQPRIAIYHRDCTNDEVKAFVDRFRTKQGKTVDRIDDDDLAIVPATHYLAWESSKGTIEEERGKPVVTVTLPRKTFLRDGTRDDREHTVQNQALAVSLDIDVHHAYPRHTLSPPFFRQLNEFYSRETCFDPWVLRVERDGIAVMTHVRRSDVTLYPIPHDLLITRIFALVGIEADASQPGRLATRIIDSMREFAPLDACRVFKVRGVRQLLTDVRATERFTWEQGLRTIGRGNFDAFRDLYIQPRTKPHLEPEEVLRFLIAKRVLAPRVRMWWKLWRRRYPFRCIHCGMESRIPPGAFEGDWRCPYCTQVHHLPEHIAASLPRRGVWDLRRAGLFARDNRQEGALPVILVLMTLQRLLDSGQWVYTTAMNLRFKRAAETDLVVLQYRGGATRDLEIGIGECKSDHGEVTADDVGKLKAVRQELERIGAVVHLIFAKTSDAFLPSEIALFRELREEGRPPVLLTSRELEPYDPYWEKGAAVPVRNPFTLAEMAHNSEARYLN